jgi:RNA recognition motif-containing protein
MSTTLSVGNIPFSTTEITLRALFETAGTVVAIRIVRDRETQREKDFGFVEFETASAAQVAIAEFSGPNIDGRPLVVKEARPREVSERR